MKKLFKLAYLPYFLAVGLVVQILGSSVLPTWRGKAPEEATYRNMTLVLSYDRAEQYELDNFNQNYGQKVSTHTFCEKGFGPMAHAALGALQEENGLLLVHPSVWQRILTGLDMARKRGIAIVTNVEKWDMFDTGTGLFLFVPKSLRDADKATQKTGFKDQASGLYLTQEEVELGVKINQLTQIADPLDADQLDLAQDRCWECRLDRVMVTKRDVMHNAKAKKTFSIFMTGHGSPPCNEQSCVKRYDPRCSSVHMSRWKALLQNLQQHMTVNVLCVDTCYGVAEHFRRHELLDQVDFPIVSMTATEAQTFGVCLTRRDSGGCAITISKDVPTFFAKTRGLAWEANTQKRYAQLADAMHYMLPMLSGGKVCEKTHHIPAVLWPEADCFESVIVDTGREEKLSKVDGTLSTNVDVLHVDVGNVGMIAIAGQTPRFVSVMTGDAQHTYEKIDTKMRQELPAFAANFFAVDELESKKTSLIKELNLGGKAYEDVVICHDPTVAEGYQDWVAYCDGDQYRRLFVQGGAITGQEELRYRPA